MAAQGPPTRQPPPPPPPAASSSSNGIELTTLFISAIASAVAAYVVSKIWAAGTLFGAAFTPVIVALVKEALRRPTEKVADVASTAAAVVPLGWTRSSASDGGLVPDPGAPEPLPVRDPDAPVTDPDAPHVVLPPVVATEHAPVSVYSTRGRRLRWRLAVVTGLLGFVVCVLVYTVPELVSGDSIGRHGSSATTIFGGHSRKHSRSTTSTTKTTDTTGTTSTTSTTRTTRTTPDQTRTTATTPQRSSATPQSTTAPPTTTTTTPSSTAPQSSTAPSNVQGAAPTPDATAVPAAP
jgi:hypothetical protein